MLSHILGILQQETTLQNDSGRQCDPKESWREETHRNSYIHRVFYTEKSLHRAALRHRNFTRRSLYTEWFLHRGVFTCFYTQKFLHTKAFTQRSLCTEAPLHEVKSWNWQHFFTKNSWQELSGTNLPHLLPKKTRISNKVPIPWICSKTHGGTCFWSRSSFNSFQAHTAMKSRVE